MCQWQRHAVVVVQAHRVGGKHCVVQCLEHRDAGCSPTAGSLHRRSRVSAPTASKAWKCSRRRRCCRSAAGVDLQSQVTPPSLTAAAVVTTNGHKSNWAWGSPHDAAVGCVASVIGHRSAAAFGDAVALPVTAQQVDGAFTRLHEASLRGSIVSSEPRIGNRRPDAPVGQNLLATVLCAPPADRCVRATPLSLNRLASARCRGETAASPPSTRARWRSRCQRLDTSWAWPYRCRGHGCVRRWWIVSARSTPRARVSGVQRRDIDARLLAHALLAIGAQGFDGVERRHSEDGEKRVSETERGNAQAAED